MENYDVFISYRRSGGRDKARLLYKELECRGKRQLVLVHVAIAVFFIGFNVYFAYIGNYLIYYLGYSPDMMGIIEAVPLVLAVLAHCLAVAL